MPRRLTFGHAMLTLSLAVTALACPAAVDYDARARYPKDEPVADAADSLLVSAHLSRVGDPLPSGLDGPRLAEALEPGHDRIVLVFARELDPLSVDPRALAILRGDGRRVRPIRALLAPANEGDENRTLVLLGNFGGEGSLPVAVHVIGPLHAETGEALLGLDAEISGPERGDVVVVATQVEPGPGRCAGAAQAVRLYWTDLLGGVEPEDLARVELGLADGRTARPVGFDDLLEAEADNVLDLCIAEAAQVVRVRAPAGLFEDAAGHPSAAVDVTLEKN